MTKVIIVSDSHGLDKELDKIYEHYKDETDIFIHCGDSELDEGHPILSKFHVVNGNCDDYSFVNEKIIEVNNKRILITHGHYHSVKYNLNTLYFLALEKQCEIVCFGHTHYPTKIYGEVTFINPGSVFANRGIRGRSFCVLTIDDQHISVKHFDLDFKEYKINEL